MTLKKVFNELRKVIIYELVCNISGKRYIGSSVNKLNVRLLSHKYNKRYCSSKQIIELNNYKENILETFETKFLLAILLKEQYYLDNTKNINVNRALTLKKQKKIQEKIWNKNYRIRNKEKIEKCKSRQKEICKCGGRYRKDSKSRHLQTIKHKKYLDSL